MKRPKQRGNRPYTTPDPCHPRTQWKDDNYVIAYELARSGLCNKDIARNLGVTLDTFKDWWRKNPAFRKAVRSGRRSSPEPSKYKNPDGSEQNPQGGERLLDYVYKLLPADMQDLWNSLHKLHKREDGTPPTTREKVEALLEGRGTHVRKMLFVHAMCVSGFVVAEACRKINIPRTVFDCWRRDDPFFLEMLAQIAEIEKDWIQGHAHALIAAREPSVVIHAMKTKLADRGYGLTVKHKHSGTIKHRPLPVDDLAGLTNEQKRQLLDAARTNNKKQEALENKITIEGTFAP